MLTVEGYRAVFSSPVGMYKKSYCPIPGGGMGMSVSIVYTKCKSFTLKFIYVMSKEGAVR